MPVNLPKWMERSEAEVAEEAKVQELRRASFSRAHQTPEERLVGQGALLEETARGNLAAGSDAMAQLAEALVMQGRYTEAAEIAPDPEPYQAVAAAIEMDDNERCDCEDTTATIDGVEIAITPRFAAKEVFSQRHGKVVSLVTCLKCGHTNAREPRSRLLISQAAMQQNRAAAQGRGLIRDVELLKVESA